MPPYTKVIAFLSALLATSATPNSPRSSIPTLSNPIRTMQAVEDPGFESGSYPKIQDSYAPHSSIPAISPWFITTRGVVNPYNPSQVGLTISNTNTGAYSFRAQGSHGVYDWSLTLAQSVRVIPNQTYTLEVWAKQQTASNCVVRAIWSDWNNVVSTFTPATHWTKVQVPIVVGDVTNRFVAVELECRNGTSNFAGWLDDITLTTVV